MSALVVIIAPPGPLGGVQDVLRDWSAVGLVEPFLWVDSSMISDGYVGAFSTNGGTHKATSLQAVATATRYDRVRIVVLVPMVQGAAVVSSADEQRVAELLEVSTGGARVTRVRAIVSRVGDAARSDEIARSGWHNIMVAAEQSEGPGLGHSLLPATSDPIALAPHTAANIAGLIGLWSDVAESPLDDEAILPGASIRLARSFYRRMQSQELETELRVRVTATSESLPLPIEGGAPAVYVQDNALATSTMSNALWERHREVLRGPREQRRPADVKPIGLFGALKMFFGFLWASLRNAPQQWYRSVVTAVASRAAGAVHGLVFGATPAAYAVVVNGVTSNGLPVGWAELSEAADAIDEALEEPGQVREHHAISDFSSLWKEYSAGALTLADGGERVEGLTPVQIGTRRAVLRTAALCVPSPDARFDEIPGHLAAHIGVASVEAYDILAINNLHQRLTIVQQEPGLGLEAGRTIEALSLWNNANKGSYAARVGSTLGESLMRTADEIKVLLRDLKAAGATEDIPAAIAARQSKLARTMRIVSIIFGVVAVIIGVVFAIGYISAAIAGIAAGVTVLTWFISLVVTFYRGQRDLFRLLNARQELAAQAELMKRNLRQAVRDLRRLTDAYAQFLAWSRLLGSMLEAPLGAVPTGSDDGTRLDPDLPLAVRLGSAVVDEIAMGNAVTALRRDVFRVGWLADPWNALIAAAPALLGPDAYELRDDPGAIFRQPAGEESLLTRWVSAVDEHGIDPQVANRLWTTIRDELDTSKREIAAELLGSIVELGKTAASRVRIETFMAQVDTPEALTAPAQFDLAVFTPTGRSANRAQVVRTWGKSQRRGLSQIAVLTQFTAGAPAYEYTVFADTAPVEPVVFAPESGPVF